MARDVPILHKDFNKSNKLSCFIRINIDDYIDVLFHMSTNVTDLPDRINCLPCEGINFVLYGINFVDQAAFTYSPKISDHALQATAR